MEFYCWYFSVTYLRDCKGSKNHKVRVWEHAFYKYSTIPCSSKLVTRYAAVTNYRLLPVNAAAASSSAAVNRFFFRPPVDSYLEGYGGKKLLLFQVEVDSSQKTMM